MSNYNYKFDCKKCGKSIYPLMPHIYKTKYEGHDDCLSCREPVNVEREAWDELEKERLNYIDKAKLLAWLNEQYKKHKPRGGYDEFNQGVQSMIDDLEQIINNTGTFDLKEDTHG